MAARLAARPLRGAETPKSTALRLLKPHRSQRAAPERPFCTGK